MPRLWLAGLCSLLVCAQEVHPGVWAGRDARSLPLPDKGHQAYLVGELHGVRQSEELLLQCLAILYERSGLRDIAIEEDAVYEPAAQAYTAWRSDVPPPDVCLREGILRGVRRFNQGRAPQDMVRIHLVDVDSPAEAIRGHLRDVARRMSLSGTRTVADLRKRTHDPRILRELRTIEHSQRAYEQGFEVSTRHGKGSPYLEDREQAIAANIEDIVRDHSSVLVYYGADHVSMTPRRDGGPKRNSPFDPMALRLKRAGVQVYSTIIFPLAGSTRWRGREMELPYTAADSRLSNGQALDRALNLSMLHYVDRKRERIKLASQDATAFEVDSYVLLPAAAPLEDLCVAR